MTAARVVTIVQARMGSSRLPGKVMADLLGRPMLERQLERLGRVRNHHGIVIATTTQPLDDVIEALAMRVGAAVFRGDESDVLSRYMGAAAQQGADVVVRVTSDCPLIDPAVVDRCVSELLQRPGLDYVSNTLQRSYPRGLDVEVVRVEALATADREATDALDREHVTRYIWRQPQRFQLANVANDSDLSWLRWTVDTEDDLSVVRAIYAALYPARPDFDLQDAWQHAQEHPAVHGANLHVEQKPA